MPPLHMPSASSIGLEIAESLIGQTKSLLCLKCKENGHVAAHCPLNGWYRDQFQWFLSEKRRTIGYGGPAEASEESLCQRCRDLNIVEFLGKELPWKRTSELNELAKKSTHSFRSIGKTGDAEFFSDCPLCRCLFALTPNPMSPDQNILLLTDWSMNRVTGETDTVTNMEGWEQFSKCLLVTLSEGSNEGSLDFSTMIHRGDALCIVQEDEGNHCLAGRLIEPHRINIDMVRDWLSACDKLHISKCQPTWSQQLPDLKLLDVNTRTIVPVPSGSFEYLALSYVWGGVKAKSYQVGSKVLEVPATIEDAIEFTRQLGKSYLWVDSLCIDQSDDEDKKKQILKMQDIYSGAYVTVIALSGTSADAGLPRVRSSEQMFPQLTCTINGKRLVGLMPTLSQQIWRAPWGTRAWTLQEALLSPRCIYISDHQLYFECNGMQACESLNDTKSWAHHLPLSSDLPSQGGWLASKVGDGCLRVPIDNPSHRIERYGSKLTLYSYRSMTHSSDGLNAFSGILQSLKTMYTKGFYFGLPIEDFQWSLLWRSQYPPKRRLGFPSWSWAGWDGGLWAAYPFDFTKPHQYPIHLRIWRATRRNLDPLFTTIHRDHFVKDPLGKTALSEPVGQALDLSKHPDARNDGLLFMEAIVLHFSPDYRRPLSKVIQRQQFATFVHMIGHVRCYIQIMGLDSELESHRNNEKQEFILLARDWMNGLVSHHLLLIRFIGDVAVRGTVLHLLIPESHLNILQQCSPVKRRLVLS